MVYKPRLGDVKPPVVITSMTKMVEATRHAKMNPKIRFIDPETKKRTLSELPYWLDDAKWAAIGETMVGFRPPRKVYLSKVMYAWERPGPHQRTSVTYGLFTEDWERPGVSSYIGGLEFAFNYELPDPSGPRPYRSEVQNSATVIFASVELDWRSKGLGKFMYKEAINDLLTVEGMTCIRSDVHRSLDAERLWASLCRTAKGKIYTVPHDMGVRGQIFETRGPPPIRRRPVRVRKYRRQA